MRSPLATVLPLVAISLCIAPVVRAGTQPDSVQEKLRAMEQRMLEMEDRLESTSDALQSARRQIAARAEAGETASAGSAMVATGDESIPIGVRSGVGNLLDLIDVSGSAAASYNYRFRGESDNNRANTTLFRHPNADTFQVDQFWLTLDKAVTEESPGGFHVDFVTGTSAAQQIGVSDMGVGIYSAFVSYLAPIGPGIQIDAGLLGTPLGGEVLDTTANMNITQGLVWGLQPVTHTGVSAAIPLTDFLALNLGVVNEVYSSTFTNPSRDPAYYAQLAFSGDNFGLSVGAIVGHNHTSGLLADADTSGGAVDEACQGGDECKTSVFNVVATADPTESLSLWTDYTWVRNFGRDNLADGDAHGVSVAGRQGFLETCGLAGRVEYIRTDAAYNRGLAGDAQQGELMTFTLTGDKSLTDMLKLRAEVRYDHALSNGPFFAFDNRNGGTDTILSRRNGNLYGLIELSASF